MLGDELFCKFVVIIVLMQEDAVGPIVVDLDFDYS